MKRFMLAAAALAVPMFAGMSQAASITSILTGGPLGVTNFISDDDFERIIDSNNNGLFDTGDVVRGFIKFNQKTNPPSSPVGSGGVNELSGIIEFRVAQTVPVVGPLVQYRFEANTGNGLGSIITLYEDTTPEQLYIAGNFAASEANAGADAGTSLFGQIGFTGAAGEGFYALLTGGNSIASLATAPEGSLLGSSVFALNRIASGGTIDGYLLTPSVIGNTTGLGPVALVGDFGGNTLVKGAPDDLRSDLSAPNQIATDTTIQFNFIGVPTPSAAMSGFALMGLMGFAGGFRRRRTA